MTGGKSQRPVGRARPSRGRGRKRPLAGRPPINRRHRFTPRHGESTAAPGRGVRWSTVLSLGEHRPCLVPRSRATVRPRVEARALPRRRGRGTGSGRGGCAGPTVREDADVTTRAAGIAEASRTPCLLATDANGRRRRATPGRRSIENTIDWKESFHVWPAPGWVYIRVRGS